MKKNGRRSGRAARSVQKREVGRRAFVAGALRGAAGVAALGSPSLRPAWGQAAPSDVVRVAVVGFGVQGFNDARAARRVDGVRVVGAASCYDGHLARAREEFGDEIRLTRDYRELLDSPDVDAVIVATPDHWHAQACLDALAAGKDVYCEKPLTHRIEEGETLVAAVKRTDRIFQVGSQHTSSPSTIEARQLVEEGALGQVTQVKASWDTNNDISAWVKPIPPDASTRTIDWERFQGPAPRHGFDPKRVFRWRTYRDYGEGLAGDVLVHIITTIHYVLGLGVPTLATAVGGRLLWKDDRDAYDTITGGWEYPEGIVSVLGATQNNSHDGTGIRIMGTRATLVMTFGSYQLIEEDSPPNYRYTTRVWPKAAREAYWESQGLSLEEAPGGGFGAPSAPKVLREFKRPEGGGFGQPWHMQHFVDCVRSRRRPVQDVEMGNDAAITAHLANLAYDEKRTVHWDRAQRRVVERS